MGSVSMILRVLVSILLVLGLLTFVSLHSIYSQIEEGDVEKIVEDIVEVGAEEIVVGDIDYGQLYSKLIQDCLTKERVVVENEDGMIDLTCQEIEDAGENGFEDLIKSKAGAEVVDFIEDKSPFSLGKESLVRPLWFVAIFNIVLILIIVLLARWSSLINLGIVGLISGIPFVAVKFSDGVIQSIISGILPLGIKVDDLSALESLVSGLTGTLFLEFLILFILGAALLGIGIGIKVGIGRRNMSKNEMKKVMKKK